MNMGGPELRTLVVAEAIQALKQVPSGHLYAHVMGHIGWTEYNAIITALIKSKLVRRDAHHMLVWIGPEKES